MVFKGEKIHIDCRYGIENYSPAKNVIVGLNLHDCFVHPIFSSFGFWYFGHFSCVIFFLVFFRLAHLALQNVNKDYVVFSYFRNFVAKSDQKPKMGWTKHALQTLCKKYELLQTKIKYHELRARSITSPCVAGIQPNSMAKYSNTRNLNIFGGFNALKWMLKWLLAGAR